MKRRLQQEQQQQDDDGQYKSSSAQSKRARVDASWSGVPLMRRLETMSKEQLQTLVADLAKNDPSMHDIIEQHVPQLSIASCKDTIARLETEFHQQFPLGNDPTSDYAYCRVRPAYMTLLSSLADFIPYFLPQPDHHVFPMDSLEFLDFCTRVVHRIPQFQSAPDNYPKETCYIDLCDAWIMSLQMSLDRVGYWGFVNSGWLKKIDEHDKESEGKFARVVASLHRMLQMREAQLYKPQKDVPHMSSPSSTVHLGFGF